MPPGSLNGPVKLTIARTSELSHRRTLLLSHYIRCARIPGYVKHDTFPTLHELFNKLNCYTTRLVQHQKIRPSIGRGVISAIGAFFKWYLFSGAWRKGKVGVATGLYATAGNDSKLLIVFYVQIMPDDFIMQLHRF